MGKMRRNARRKPLPYKDLQNLEKYFLAFKNAARFRDRAAHRRA
jgi:hypothetical protein